MFGFKKKPKNSNLELPPFPTPAPKKDEIELLPEDGVSLEPSKTPETYNVPTFPTIPKEESAPIVKQKIEMIPSQDIFIKTEVHQKVIADINDIDSQFEDMNIEISKVIELKNNRYNKVDALQQVLEDTTKKLLYLDNALFGGTK